MDKTQKEKPRFTFLTAFFSRPFRKEIIFAEDLKHAADQLEISFKKPASKTEDATFILIDGDSLEEIQNKVESGLSLDLGFIAIQFQPAISLTTEFAHFIAAQADRGAREFALIGLTPEQKNYFMADKDLV